MEKNLPEKVACVPLAPSHSIYVWHTLGNIHVLTEMVQGHIDCVLCATCPILENFLWVSDGLSVTRQGRNNRSFQCSIMCSAHANGAWYNLHVEMNQSSTLCVAACPLVCVNKYVFWINEGREMGRFVLLRFWRFLGDFYQFYPSFSVSDESVKILLNSLHVLKMFDINRRCCRDI